MKKSEMDQPIISDDDHLCSLVGFRRFEFGSDWLPIILLYVCLSCSESWLHESATASNGDKPAAQAARTDGEVIAMVYILILS